MYKVIFGTTPIPFSIIFVTIEIDADIALACVCVAGVPPKYWVALVTLILFTFEVIVGNEPVLLKMI